MQKEVVIILLAICALTYLVIIPMIRNVAKFGLEKQFFEMEENQLSNAQVAKLILLYNMRCLGGTTLLLLIYIAVGILIAIAH